MEQLDYASDVEVGEVLERMRQIEQIAGLVSLEQRQ